MIFEWDDDKAKQNVVKHRVPFEYAVRVFFDPHRMDCEDTRRDYPEERRIILGKIDGRIFAVAYTRRSTAIRVISARKANDREKRKL